MQIIIKVLPYLLLLLTDSLYHSIPQNTIPMHCQKTQKRCAIFVTVYKIDFRHYFVVNLKGLYVIMCTLASDSLPDAIFRLCKVKMKE